jgi:hypothetical protein
MMATKTVIICDICGKTKQDTNGWFRIGVSALNGLFNAWHGEEDGPQHYHQPYRDACGSECCHKAFDRWLSHGTLEEQP